MAKIDLNDNVTDGSAWYRFLVQLGFLAAACFPFNYRDPLLAFLMFAFGTSVIMILCGKSRGFYFFAVSFLVVFLQILIALIYSYPMVDVLYGALPYLTLLWGTIAFYSFFVSMKRLDPYVFTSILAAIGLSLYIGYSQTSSIFMNEHNLLVISLLFFSLVYVENKLWRSIAVSLFVLLSISSGRLAPVAVGVATLIALLLPFLMIRATSFFSLLVVLFVPLTAVFIDREQLFHLYEIDRNSAIRVEFVWASWELLRDKILSGVGFGSPYRNSDYWMVFPHPLLFDANAAYTVATHHSLFEILFRFGVLFSPFFVFPFVYIISKRRNSSLDALALFTVASGLSLNAWLENQHYVPATCFLFGFLLARMKTDRVIPPQK